MFRISDDFPAIDASNWRQQVVADLKGASFEKKLTYRTLDGLAIQPLYIAADARGGPPVLRRSLADRAVRPGEVAAWWLGQRHDESSPTAAARAIREDLEGGCRALEIVVSCGALVDGTTADARGIPLKTIGDLDEVLKVAPLADVLVSLDARGSFIEAAALYHALLIRRGVDAGSARVWFNADPLAVAARGAPFDLDRAFADLGMLARHSRDTLANARSVGVSDAPYMDAGAHATQALAFSLATALEYLRTMVSAGLSPAEASRQIVFGFQLDSEFFQEIAKLRAARWLWASVLAHIGAPIEPIMMQIRTSRRTLTARDPWVNMLRTTTTAFAGALGGADLIILPPFDALLETRGGLARRVARNTQHILASEAHLGLVEDPAAGSWFLDALTEDLARGAWGLLQALEGRGGMRNALLQGEIGAALDAVHSERLKGIARRKQPITGVSEFPNLGEVLPAPVVARDPSPHLASSMAADGASPPSAPKTTDRVSPIAERVAAVMDGAPLETFAHHGHASSIPALPVRRFAEPFEDLRRAADEYEARHGRRPRAYLANLGPTAEHTARTTFVRNLLAAGGIASVESTSGVSAKDAVREAEASEVRVVVLCGADARYAAEAGEMARSLKAAGIPCVVLAGRPADLQDALTSAGVDTFVYLGCDVVEALTRLHDRMEIDR